MLPSAIQHFCADWKFVVHVNVYLNTKHRHPTRSLIFHKFDEIFTSDLYEQWINSKCPYRPPTHNYTLYLVLTEQNENKEAQGTVLIVHWKS